MSSALALIGIGVNPYDTDSGAHETALFSWVMLLLVTVSLHFWALLTSKECSDIFSIASFGLTMAIGIYFVRGLDLLAAPWHGTVAQSVSQAIAMQKLVAFSAVAWYLLFGIRAVFITRICDHWSETPG